MNDAPVNSVPGTQQIEANTSAAIAGLSIADADAGSGTLTTTLSVLHGTLTVASAGGAAVAGSGTASVTLTGTLAQINTTLARREQRGLSGRARRIRRRHADGHDQRWRQFRCRRRRSDTDQVAINLTTWLIGTPGDDSYAALPGNERIDAGYGNDTVTFGFTLVDATVTYAGNKVIIDGPTGSHTVLTGFEKYVFTDGTVDNADGNRLVDDLFYYSQNHDVWNAARRRRRSLHDVRLAGAARPERVLLDRDLSLGQSGRRGGGPQSAGALCVRRAGTKGACRRSPSIRAQYLAANPDVAAAQVDPLFHFLTVGAGEGRQPIRARLAGHRERLRLRLLPAEQSGRGGRAVSIRICTSRPPAGRKAAIRTPISTPRLSRDLHRRGGRRHQSARPLSSVRLAEGRDPSVDFDTNAYLAANPDVEGAAQSIR